MGIVSDPVKFRVNPVFPYVHSITVVHRNNRRPEGNGYLKMHQPNQIYQSAYTYCYSDKRLWGHPYYRYPVYFSETSWDLLVPVTTILIS